jgi:hypothetical protein
MIRPTYIRFIVSPNQNPTPYPASQGGHPVISGGTSFDYQNFPRIQSGTSSPTAISRIIINPKLNLSSGITSVNKSTPVTAAPIDELSSKPSSSNNILNESNTSKNIHEPDRCKFTSHITN